jgi:hypothetical protein
VERRQFRNGLRAPAHPQSTDRGGVHESRSGTDGGGRDVDQAAADLWPGDQRAAGPVLEGGRAVQIDADEGAPLLRELIQRDADANRLGEVALVDCSGRVGPSGTVFHDTLLDENAASHIALGSGFTHLAGDEQVAARINQSAVHTDFMLGGPEVRITGVTRDGREVPVLLAEQWGL